MLIIVVALNTADEVITIVTTITSLVQPFPFLSHIIPSFAAYTTTITAPIAISTATFIANLELKQFTRIFNPVQSNHLPFGTRNQNPYLEVVISKMFTISVGVIALKVVVVVNLYYY